MQQDEPHVPQRAVLDASVLLSGYLPSLLAAADLGYYHGYWSIWIVGELVRKRTEWIATRAVREGLGRTMLRQKLLESRRRVNALVDDLSRVLHSVDYSRSPPADLSWLKDPDDWPIMQTALAARADILVTGNSGDFPLEEQRNGVLILGPAPFIEQIYTTFPEAAAAIRDYLHRT